MTPLCRRPTSSLRHRRNARARLCAGVRTPGRARRPRIAAGPAASARAGSGVSGAPPGALARRRGRRPAGLHGFWFPCSPLKSHKTRKYKFQNISTPWGPGAAPGARPDAGGARRAALDLFRRRRGRGRLRAFRGAKDQCNPEEQAHDLCPARSHHRRRSVRRPPRGNPRTRRDGRRRPASPRGRRARQARAAVRHAGGGDDRAVAGRRAARDAGDRRRARRPAAPYPHDHRRLSRRADARRDPRDRGPHPARRGRGDSRSSSSIPRCPPPRRASPCRS